MMAYCMPLGRVPKRTAGSAGMSLMSAPRGRTAGHRRGRGGRRLSQGDRGQTGCGNDGDAGGGDEEQAAEGTHLDISPNGGRHP